MCLIRYKADRETTKKRRRIECTNVLFLWGCTIQCLDDCPFCNYYTLRCQDCKQARCPTETGFSASLISDHLLLPTSSRSCFPSIFFSVYAVIQHRTFADHNVLIPLNATPHVQTVIQHPSAALHTGRMHEIFLCPNLKHTLALSNSLNSRNSLCMCGVCAGAFHESICVSYV